MGIKAFLKNIVAFSFKAIYKTREQLWNYPDKVVKIVYKTRPLSYIMLLTILLYPLREIIFIKYSDIFLKETNVIHEAYIGKISRVNPLFETNNQIEKDLIDLVYSPLFRIDNEGKLTYMLAKSYTASKDGLSYTFTLNDDVWWHNDNNEKINKFTADDVVFTFNNAERIVNQKITVIKDDDYKVTFKLEQPSPVFLENITIGIMPNFIWENVDKGRLDQFYRNQYPIGTGPYKVKKFTADKEIILERNPLYFDGAPLIDKIYIDVYSNNEDLIKQIERKKVTSILNPPKEVEDLIKKEYPEFVEYKKSISRNTKIIFLNNREKIVQRENKILSNAEIRRAISLSINKEDLITQIDPSALISKGPISSSSWAFDESVNYYDYNLEDAAKTLDANGWKVNEEDGFRYKNKEKLSIELIYLDNESNSVIANKIKEYLKISGIDVALNAQKYNKLTQETIPLRNFDMLLFEIETLNDPDPYKWWDSSFIDHPGLNLSGYSNNQVDKRLEKARITISRDERKQLYHDFLDYFAYDMPAIYLYHPSIKYFVKNNVYGVDLSLITIANERFNNISYWKIQ